MPYCIAFGCNNRSEDYQRGISFFRLPLKNERLLQQWVAKLQLKDPPLKETSRICSEHFTEDCFVKDYKSQLMPDTKVKRMLKPDAVPTIFSFKKVNKSRTVSKTRAKDKQKKETVDLLLEDSAFKSVEVQTGMQHGILIRYAIANNAFNLYAMLFQPYRSLID